MKTLSQVEKLAQNYAQKVIDEKRKLFKTKDNTKNNLNLNNIIEAIENRTTNIIQRIQYDTKQKEKIIFCETLHNNIQI